jgi:acetyl esterase/lipase
MDPKFQYVWKTWRKPLPIAQATPEQARAGWLTLVKITGPKPNPDVRTETVTLDGPAGPLTARVYLPPDQDPQAPLLVFFHEGGGVAGDLDASDGFCTRLAAVARCPILAPAYRLAPEHKFPAGFEDALASYRWARDNAGRYGARAGTAMVGGQSMGANFAAAICQTLKRAGEPQPALQLLVNPILDATADSQSMQTYGDMWPLSREALLWIFGHYLGPETDPTDPRVSPFRADDVTGLACAVVVTSGFDPVVDQGELYARKLRAAGVPVVYRCYDPLAHGFPAFAGVVPEAEVACREIAGLLREGIEGRVTAAASAPDHSDAEKCLVF